MMAATNGTMSRSGNGITVTLNWDGSELKRNLAKINTEKLMAVTLMYAATEAKELESYMKTHRPWTDRTGLAKQSLSSAVSQESNTLVCITLGFGLNGINCPYGIWLELAHEKNYAIIQPTINTQGPKILKNFEGMMTKIAG